MAPVAEAKRPRTKSASRHADWLSLIEISGPFLTLPVLDRIFPQGLDARDPEKGRELRARFAEWEAEQEKRRPDRAIHQAWVRWVLAEVLDYEEEAALAEGQSLPANLEARITQEGETLRPDLALLDPDTKTPVLLIQIYDPSQNLSRVVEGKRWKAEPGTRMAELLRATAVPLGLVTNGERWMLVHALKDETTGFASWYANLWLEEPQTLRAFTSLLGIERFFRVAEDATLPALLKESAQNQQEVTDKLGLQVREAVELLVQAIDRIDKERGRELLRGFGEQRLYEATLAVMMRLVFLLSAEERGLLRLGDPIWDANYAVSTLGAQLREEADRHGEELLERRSDAWARLLATFRAVHGGVRHEALSLPAYGGALFDPDRYPFLEGRPRNTDWRAVPGPRRCRSTTARCCTSSRRCSTSASAAARRAGSRISPSTSSRSVTSTRVCSTTPPGAPPSPCSGSRAARRRGCRSSPRSRSPTWSRRSPRTAQRASRSCSRATAPRRPRAPSRKRWPRSPILPTSPAYGWPATMTKSSSPASARSGACSAPTGRTAPPSFCRARSTSPRAPTGAPPAPTTRRPR